MYTKKLHAGAEFPKIHLPDLAGTLHELGVAQNGADWKLVVIYRGQHCPLCTRYLNNLQDIRDELLSSGIDVVAASGDSKAQLKLHSRKLNVEYPLVYGLTQEQMHQLGLYISIPRSEQETDHNFAEPGVFVVNQYGTVQVVDLSNNPFVRPDLGTLVSGLKWIRDPENDYPIRGTYK